LNSSFVLQTSAGSKKIVGVFYKAGEYADKNPNFVGCVEGALGIRGWLESQGHQYIVTNDKEGPNCGQYSPGNPPPAPTPAPKPRIGVLLIYLRAAPTKTYELALSILFYISIEEKERKYIS